MEVLIAVAAVHPPGLPTSLAKQRRLYGILCQSRVNILGSLVGATSSFLLCMLSFGKDSQVLSATGVIFADSTSETFLCITNNRLQSRQKLGNTSSSRAPLPSASSSLNLCIYDIIVNVTSHSYCTVNIIRVDTQFMLTMITTEFPSAE